MSHTILGSGCFVQLIKINDSLSLNLVNIGIVLVNNVFIYLFVVAHSQNPFFEISYGTKLIVI